MNAIDSDANLMRAFELVSLCGVELNGLLETATELFEEHLQTLPPDFSAKYEGKVISKDRYDKSGWLITDTAVCFPLKKKKSTSPEPVMYICYQISMYGNGLMPSNKVPLLHVFLWSCAVDFDEELCIHFPYDDTSLIIDDARLLVWGERQPSNWDGREWAFSIKLTSLNNRQNLLESVVNPALDLLQMKSAKEALPDNLPGLVLYRDSDVIPEQG